MEDIVETGETVDVEALVLPPPAVLGRVRGELAEQLVAEARVEGVDLVGPGGLLGDLTKRVLEASLEAEMDDHLGYAKHDAVGRDGGNSRNGTRSKTVITDVGPVDIEVPRDRDGSFAPQTVAKRQRRLGGVNEMVISLTARGMTTGRRRLVGQREARDAQPGDLETVRAAPSHTSVRPARPQWHGLDDRDRSGSRRSAALRQGVSGHQ